MENTILWLGDDTNSNIICYISLRIKIRTWIFQRQTNPLQDILSVLALPCFCTYLQKVWSKKTNKKHFKTLEKEKYVTPDQIFEAAWTAIWTVDDLAPPTYLTFKDVDIQMFHDNTCPLFFVIILLNHSVQCCCNAQTSPLINTVKYCTGCYIIATLGLKLWSSIQQRMQWHISFIMIWVLLSLSKCQLVFMTFFSPHAQNLELWKSY